MLKAIISIDVGTGKLSDIITDWSPKFETGLNIIKGIVQNVYEWSSCPFPNMIPQWENHLGKRTAWSLIYFLNYLHMPIMICSPVYFFVPTLQQKNSHLTYSIKYTEIFSSVNPAINKLLIYGVCRTNFSHFQTMIGLFASRKFDTMGVTFLWGGIPWSQGQNHILMVFSSVQYYFT